MLCFMPSLKPRAMEPAVRTSVLPQGSTQRMKKDVKNTSRKPLKEIGNINSSARTLGKTVYYEETKEEPSVLMLGKMFTSTPVVSFGNVKLGFRRVSQLRIVNEEDTDVKIRVEKLVDLKKKGFAIKSEEFLVPAQSGTLNVVTISH